jgi:mannan endo-1,4-beta-mannosidase
MRHVYKVGGLIAVVLVLMGLLQTTMTSQALQGFYVSNGRLYDANGNEFIMRGVNHAHTWYTSQTSSFANIKNAGANAVRVVLSSGHRWTRNDAADVANVIALCKQNHLICMLEVHDTTGYGEEGAAATLDQAVDYWISIQSALMGEEAYVLINIGNEPYGTNGYQTWAADTSAAIVRLRNAGFDHTIVVDAPNWGQDWSFTMRDNAASVFNSDPDANMIFSIHMYGVFDTAVEIQNYLNTFVNAGLPIMVGEFGHNHSDGDPDEDAILATTQSLGLGYLGWSWSGNGGGVEYLDMVINFDPNNMSAWGDRLFNGVNGIAQTAQEASVFGTPVPTHTPGGPTNTPVPPTNTPLPPTNTPTATPSPSGICVVAYAVANSWGNNFQANVTITNNNSAAIAGWTLTFTHAAGQTVTGGWNATLSQSGNQVTVSNPASYWNGTIAANGGSVTFGLQGTFTGSVVIPSDYAVNGTACNTGGNTPTATPIPPTATSTSPTATSMPPTATAVPPTATSIPPTATSVPPTATPGTGAGCTVTYVVQQQWGNGFIGNVTIGVDTAVSGWTLQFTFSGNQAVSNMWGGLYSQSGSAITINNESWNGNIAANGTISFGFQASYSDSNATPTPFILNGEVCN